MDESDSDLEIPDFSQLTINRPSGLVRLPPASPIVCITLSDNETTESGNKSRSHSEGARQEVEVRKKVHVKKAVRTWKTAAEEAASKLRTEKRKWKPAEEVESMKDSDDEDIDNFIRENHMKPKSFWDSISEKMQKQRKPFEIDYIITTEKEPKPLQGKDEVWLLTKWSNYAIPTWNLNTDVSKGKKSSDQLVLMEKKVAVEKRLEEILTMAKGSKKAFNDAFPHRWMDTYEELSEYVEEPRALYLNKARAWEWRMNFEYYAAHKRLKRNGSKEEAPAPIFVINWVDEGTVPGMDTDFKFITSLQHTPRVADILANTDELAWVKCIDPGEQAPNRCNQSCSVPREHYHKMSACCGIKYGAVIHYYRKKMHTRMVDPAYVETVPEVGEDAKRTTKKTDKKKGKIKKEEEKKKGEVKEEEEEEEEDENVKLIVPAQLTSHEVENGIIVECTADCGCDRNACRQNVVQRGRQIPLIIFREDPAKGWGLRAGAPIKRNEFVTEYLGEVLTAKEQAKHHSGSHYMFTMRFGWAENLLRTDRVKNLPEGMRKEIIRRHKPLSIDATNMGNESRFINHSCEPNLVAMAVFVERHGEFYHRIALFARKDIPFGEELTFDYFPSEKDIGVWRSMFDKCRCGTASCKFKELEADEKSSEDEDDDDNASTVSSLDSFLSDNEAYDRKKKYVEWQIQREREQQGRKKKFKKKKMKKEEEESDEEEDNEHKITHRVTDLTRDPLVILEERCDGDTERLQQLMQERTQHGILGKFTHIPFDRMKQEDMFAEARESISARREQQRRREERRMDEDRRKREEEGEKINEEDKRKKENDHKRKRSG